MVEKKFIVENIEVKIGEGDKTLLLLSSLFISFEHLKDVFLHDKEGILYWM